VVEQDVVMLTVVFPEQGAEWPHMGAAWRERPSWERVREVSEAADCDVELLLLASGPRHLAEPVNAALATFAFDLVVADALVRLGVTPALWCGSGAGECAASVAAGTSSVIDACRRLLIETTDQVRDDNSEARSLRQLRRLPTIKRAAAGLVVEIAPRPVVTELLARSVSCVRMLHVSQPWHLRGLLDDPECPSLDDGVPAGQESTTSSTRGSL
jgi:acyl transferase domain-containing protein